MRRLEIIRFTTAHFILCEQSVAASDYVKGGDFSREKEEKRHHYVYMLSPGLLKHITITLQLLYVDVITPNAHCFKFILQDDLSDAEFVSNF